MYLINTTMLDSFLNILCMEPNLFIDLFINLIFDSWQLSTMRWQRAMKIANLKCQLTFMTVSHYQMVCSVILSTFINSVVFLNELIWFLCEQILCFCHRELWHVQSKSVEIPHKLQVLSVLKQLPLKKCHYV